MNTDGEHLTEVIRLSRQLSELADEAEAECLDDESRVFYGIVRDCAYKLIHTAENNRQLRSGLAWGR